MFEKGFKLKHNKKTAVITKNSFCIELKFYLVFDFQLQVVAYDPARPRNKAYKDIIIQVLRNQNEPVWSLPLNDVVMRADHPIYVSVVTDVEAADTRDNVSAWGLK